MAAASAPNPLAVACLLLLVVAAGAARTEPDAKAAEMLRRCHSDKGWSGRLCRYVCQASGFAGYDFAQPNAANGDLARCCCCPKDHACVQVDA
ncbi:hypothetical protein SETIT_1G238100v2 [Setaria italica]|uniref:Knottin scorpion toxin-like domain-containing protein n=1 Tax=Setaria italica TaxID=4555 RepID=K3Z240_SETIT|nr:hypothetical protein SETIT_1G238100v2 [Setaria italica]